MSFTLKSTVLAAALALAIPLASAQPADGMMGKHPMKAHKMGKVGKPGKMGKMGKPFYGIQLSEKQQDEIFNINHNAEPQFREKRKALRQLEEEMAQLKNSDKYSLATAKDLQSRISAQRAEMDLMRAETDFAIFNVLTPEQKVELRKAKEEWKKRAGPQKGAPMPAPQPAPGV